MEFKHCKIDFTCDRAAGLENCYNHFFIITEFGEVDITLDEHEMGTLIGVLIDTHKIVSSGSAVCVSSTIISERCNGDSIILVCTKICNKIEIILYSIDQSNFLHPKKTSEFRFDKDDDFYELLKIFSKYITKNKLGCLKLEIERC